MSRLNNTLKFVLINVNMIFAVIGMFLMAMAIYLFVGNFGKLDPGLFTGTALVVGFAGTSVVLGSIIGCQGANNQNEKLDTWWTGRKVTGLYQLLLFCSLAIELVLLSTCLRAAGEYAQVYPKLQAGEVQPYVSLEDVMQIKFNTIYYSARTTCTVTVYNQFWDWVDHHCPKSMSSVNCQACDEYSLTLCGTDRNECFATSNGDGPFCPYTMCRAEVLKYMTVRIQPVSYCILALCAFQFVVSIVNLMIMCFTPRDNLEKILIKSGTLAAAKNNAD